MIFLLIIQTVVISRLPLLEGTADLILLALVAWALQERVPNPWVWTLIGGGLVSFISALPFPTPVLGYLMATGIARVLQKRVWQMPILAMFVATVVGTVLYQTLSILVLRFLGTSLIWGECISLVILPSILLNSLLSLPVYAVVVDFAGMLYPDRVEV